jgi:rod shape determining protein RodA
MEQYRALLLKKISNIPITISVVVTLLCVYGFILLYSAADGNIHPWAYKQIMIFCLFIPIVIFISLLDLKIIFSFSYIFYLFVLILLILVETMGKTAMGATRWIEIAGIRLQPSELSKIAIVLMLAKYFHNNSKRTDSGFFRNILVPLMAVIVPVALIIKQPDLGTGIITFLVAIIMFFVVGTRLIYFFVAGIMGILSLPIAWYFMYTYQKNRVLIFLNPEKEPLGAGYNIIQSKIAIGSGGVTGKGLFSGTQSHLSFLPEYQTDFIFAFLTEELGFVGGISLLLLYILLILSSLSVAINCKSVFAKLMVVGVCSIFFCHIFINIAMVMGMMPAVGVPLPLISYGGTMMASMLIGFGLIMNASVNQHSNL